VDYFEEGGFSDWLGYVLVASCGAAADERFGQGGGGQSHDWGRRAVIVAFPVANRARRGVPVHHGHLNVHQDQIVLVRDEVLDCECAVFDFVDFVRRVFEERANQQPVIGGIVGDQDSQRFGRWRRHARWMRGAVAVIQRRHRLEMGRNILNCESRVETEGAATSEFAIFPDLARKRDAEGRMIGLRLRQPYLSRSR